MEPVIPGVLSDRLKLLSLQNFDGVNLENMGPLNEHSLLSPAIYVKHVSAQSALETLLAVLSVRHGLTHKQPRMRHVRPH